MSEPRFMSEALRWPSRKRAQMVQPKRGVRCRIAAGAATGLDDTTSECYSMFLMQT